MGGCASNLCLCCIGDYDEYNYYKQEQIDASPSCWPCAATDLYVPLPSSHNVDACRLDAEYLRHSMKGWGTKDSNLGRLMANRTPAQLRRIKEIFDQEFSTEITGAPSTLEQWIKDDTTGDWEKVLLITLQDPAMTYAQLLYETTDGVGTADDELIELMTTINPAKMAAIRDAYATKFGRALAANIIDDTSFNYQQTLVALTDRAEYLAKQLHDAIAGAGTDDIALIRILMSTPRSNGLGRRLLAEFEDHINDGLKEELEYEFGMPDLQDVKAAYQRLFHRSLVQDVASDTTGNYRRALLTALQPPEETTADALNLGMEGKGTDDQLLIEVMTCRSNRQLQEAAQVYQRKYGRPLRDAIQSDCSGRYEDTLLSLLQPRYEKLAWSVQDAMAGVGTDDTRLMGLMVNRSRHEMRKISVAFQAMFGKSLIEWIKSDTSFYYKRYLVYLVTQANEDLLWVPEAQLKRLRDF